MLSSLAQVAGVVFGLILAGKAYEYIHAGAEVLRMQMLREKEIELERTRGPFPLIPPPVQTKQAAS